MLNINHWELNFVVAPEGIKLFLINNVVCIKLFEASFHSVRMCLKKKKKKKQTASCLFPSKELANKISIKYQTEGVDVFKYSLQLVLL